MSWSLEIGEPIELPKGKNLVTLRDAALYITKLPKARTQRERMAGRDAGAVAGCRTGRPDDVRPDRRDASASPTSAESGADTPQARESLQDCAMKLIFKHGFNFHSGTPYRYS
jgi:hypothetical protein